MLLDELVVDDELELLLLDELVVALLVLELLLGVLELVVLELVELDVGVEVGVLLEVGGARTKFLRQSTSPSISSPLFHTPSAPTFTMRTRYVVPATRPVACQS